MVPIHFSSKASVAVVLTVSLFGLLAGAAPIAAKTLAGSRPNIILVITDDQGMGDLSCTGNPYLQTPHLDAFHAQSIRFSDFHVKIGRAHV